jgi:hypothetical protein
LAASVIGVGPKEYRVSLVDELKSCLQTGRFRALRGAYASDARFEAVLPSGTLVRDGPDDIIALFADWWPSPGTLVHWNVTSYEEGLELVFERHPVDDERPWTSRHWQEVRVAGGRIVRHLSWSDTPRHVGEFPVLPDAIARLVDGGQRTPLYEGGFSGSRLERIVVPDGDAYFLKHISPRRDLFLRATHDSGREATLFRSGLLDRVGEAIDYPVLAVAREADGWAILMRDVSGELVAAEGDGGSATSPVSTQERRRILRAVGRLHEAFQGESIPAACSVVDRLQMLGPHAMEREASDADALPRWIRGSWEVFYDVVPADVGSAVAAIHDDPEPLAARLSAGGTTLIHGDLWAPNIGLGADRVILLDWALACQAPMEMEHAFWVLWNTEGMATTPDALLEDVRSVAGDRLDEHTLDLAFLGEFVSGAGARGWAWNSVNHPDPVTRQRDADELTWWIRRARRALENEWSPG